MLPARRPALGVLWLSEPDHTGHKAPLGCPAHRAAITAADRCVRRVLDTVETLVVTGDDMLLLVCSDHGMETTRRTIRLDDLLVEAGLKTAPDSRDVVVAPNGTAAVLYRSAGARASVDDLRGFVEKQDWVDRVFTGAELVSLGMPASAPVALVIALRTDDQPNEFGVRGVGDIVHNPDEPKETTRASASMAGSAAMSNGRSC